MDHNLVTEKVASHKMHGLSSNKYSNDSNRCYYQLPLSWESWNGSRISCIHVYSSCFSPNQITKKRHRQNDSFLAWICLETYKWHVLFFVLVWIIYLYISTYICELENICFRIEIKYFQRLTNKMRKLQHFLIKVANYSSHK